MSDLCTVLKYRFSLKGRIISQRFVEGEQFKGEVSEEYVEAVIAEQTLTDNAQRKPLPRHLQRSRSEYFSHVYRDLPQDKVQAAQEKLDAETP